MSVVFFGASALGFKCCEKIINSNVKIDAIFTIPQKFSIKYSDEKERKNQENVLFRNFNYFQEKFGIPVHTIENNVKEYRDYIKNLTPDLLVVIGWYYMIPNDILNLFKKGCVAIHGSLLPKYRGNAPLVWSIINGEKKTGITLFYLEGGIDEGDIIAQQEFEITESDTINNLLIKAENASLKIIDVEVKKLLEGKSLRIPQNHKEATYFPKRTPDDGEIDWSWDAIRIKNFIKAQTKPYPGAFTFVNDKKVIIWDADIILNIN